MDEYDANSFDIDEIKRIVKFSEDELDMTFTLPSKVMDIRLTRR